MGDEEEYRGRSLGDFLNEPLPFGIAGSAGLRAEGVRVLSFPAIGRSNGIRGYHGSPHDFDKFDMGKIGTGEGGRSSGRGVNLTDSEGEAHTYKFPDSRDNPFVKSKFKTSGHVYEVNVRANPEDFVDLNLPVKMQPKAVQDAVREWVDKTDQGPERRLSHYIKDEIPIEERLAAAGFKGFKDQRGQFGNLHHIVFDPKLIEIVKKDGITVGRPSALGTAAVRQSDALGDF